MKRLCKKVPLVFCLVLVLPVCGSTGKADRGAPVVLAQDNAPTLSAIAYEGMPTPMGGVFQRPDGQIACFSAVDINDAGDVVFWGYTSNDDHALFLYSAKTKAITKVVAIGDPSPYATPFDWVPPAYQIARLTDQGVVYFTAKFKNPEGKVYDNAGIFFYYEGRIGTVVSNEMVVDDTKGTWEGRFTIFRFRWDNGSWDVNERGDVVIDSIVEYVDPDTGIIEEYESGVYLRRAGKTKFEKILLVGQSAPGGGYVGDKFRDKDIPTELFELMEHPSVFIGDSRHVARLCYIDDPPGTHIAGTILLRSPQGVWSRTVTTGDLLPMGGPPGGEEVEVKYLRYLVGVNAHGQVGTIVEDPNHKKHFYVYSGGEAYRVAGDGTPAPSREGFYVDTVWDAMSAAMSDNRVPLDWPIPDFSAEAVFMVPVSNNPPRNPPRYYDVCSYTSDGAVRSVALGDSTAPDPPGGQLFPHTPFVSGIYTVALNNVSQIVINNRVSGGGWGDELGVLLLTSLDSDGDSLLDVWERDGIDVNDDGTCDLLLPVMGATQNHKDIFVEIDYMAGHRPNTTAINDVIDAFWNATVENPDGDQGIRLHVLIDDEITHIQFPKMFEDFDIQKDFYFGTSVERDHYNKENILRARSLVYHYCIFGDKYQYQKKGSTNWTNTTSSGLAETPGNDFLVSLGAFTGGVGSRDEQAGTFMHELGHNLGLLHGGGDRINCKPNYLSVMSYSRQFKYFINDRPLDYSREELNALDESNLNEGVGIGGPAGEKTVFFTDTNFDTYNDKPVVVNADGPINWNQAGGDHEAGVSVDLNSLIWWLDAHGDPVWRFDDNDRALQVLKGHNDWANLVYNFRHTGGFAHGAHPDVADPDMTWELVQSLRELANDPPNMPSDPSPADNATGVSISTDLNWTGGDPDPEDAVTYDVYFGTNSTPPLVCSNQTATTYDLPTLSYNTTYYWQIIATDSYEAETTGPVWNFTTAGEWDPWVYDEDDSNYIEIGELLQAINDYIGGDITISQLLQLINLYISHAHR